MKTRGFPLLLLFCILLACGCGPNGTAAPLPTPTLSPAADWKSWPVIPVVSERAREIYQRGLRYGNDPHAFSVFGDCRNYPQTFLGMYETDPQAAAALPPALQETIANFSGSFSRYSPTVRGGTTPAGLLWPGWHLNEYGCSSIESPVDCELRIHKPSIVIVNVGLDWSPQDVDYLRTILRHLTGAGVLPILATKADNWEGDDHINQQLADLAAEFDIPLWNFWAAVADLPNRGLFILQGQETKGKIFLTAEALERYRLTGLQALDAVWRAASGR